MTPTYTPKEIEALALELAKFHRPSADAALRNEYADARWILSRFVRRDREHGLLAELCEENERLRAELRGQRCDGSGHFRSQSPDGVQRTMLCSGCPACPPKATPKGAGKMTLPPVDHEREVRDALARSHASDGASGAGGVYNDSPVQSAAPVTEPSQIAKSIARHVVATLYESGLVTRVAGPAAPVTIDVLDDLINSGTLAAIARRLDKPLTIELGPTTLRTLVAAFFQNGDWYRAPRGCVETTDALLAALATGEK